MAMSDRDRLAADLESIDDKHTSNPTYWATVAGRLIALGWTRPREPGVYPTPNGIDVVVDVAESASWVEDEFPDEVAHLIAHAPLDEERLVRALRKWGGSGRSYWRVRAFPFEATEADAAAIAKAYRDDHE